jgi:hypothetical protein
MNRFFSIVASTVVAGLVGSNLPAQAQPGSPRPTGEDRVRRVARTGIGNIEGVVLDERGTPLAGATVSALGSSKASAVTDRRGAFNLKSLPAGSYLVGAQRTGYTPSPRRFVQVAASGPTRYSVTLQRSEATDETPRILAAGIGPAGEPLSLDPAGEGSTSGTETDHGETAWRLRHLRRSILKEAERAALEGSNEAPAGTQPGTFALIARAMETPARFLGDLPLSGEVHLLTSGTFDGGTSFLAPPQAMRGVAFVSISGPAWGHADWSGQAMAQQDLGSWFLAGAYRKRAPAEHAYDIGVSYSTQHFAPGSRWPIAMGSEGTRSAGAIYGVDQWTLSPGATLVYGARYARYDYLGGRGLLSPRISLTVTPLKGFRLSGTLARRMTAPGAEEFLEPLVSGLWVPPERTFLGFEPLVAQRTQHYEVSAERDLPRSFVATFRGFYQLTANQQVAVFGLSTNPAGSTGYYAVGNGGGAATSGWSIGISNVLASHVRGSVAYTLSRSHWLPGVATDYGLLLVGTGARPSSELLNDVTTAVEADVPLTATRLFVACRLNTGFARREQDAVKPGLETRFDVQVLQRLPFLDFTSARWQAMLAVRNLFRDAADDASIYDELLVVRPPTRVVTGLLVRF